MTESDHLWKVSPWVGPVEHEMLECYTTLAFVAAHTSRINLMAMVTGAHFRHPSLLAKIVTTLDVLSGGRAWLGIGAGYYEEEARGLGIDLPPVAERFERLEEVVQICLRMWAGDHGDDHRFEGRRTDRTAAGDGTGRDPRGCGHLKRLRGGSPNAAEVLDLVRHWVAAEQHNAAGLLGGLLTNDFVGVGPVGFVLTRDQ